MLEWLKTILGEAHTEEIDKKVSDEIGKSFVARNDFNAVKAELKTARETIAERDGQLETLKKSDVDVPGLRKQIEDLQADNKQKDEDYATELKRTRLDAAVDMALLSAKAKNTTAAKALLAEFMKNAALGDDGAVKGLDAELKRLAEAEDSAFLFDTEKSGGFRGFKPGESRKDPPPADKKPEEMTYEELCAHLEAHPDAQLE